MNVIARLEFDLVYNEVTVLHISHYATGLIKKSEKKNNRKKERKKENIIRKKERKKNYHWIWLSKALKEVREREREWWFRIFILMAY